jgi:hypothetical protein
MLIAVWARCEAEYPLTGLSVTFLAAHRDTRLQFIWFCELKEPDQPPDNVPDGLRYG